MYYFHDYIKDKFKEGEKDIAEDPEHINRGALNPLGLARNKSVSEDSINRVRVDRPRDFSCNIPLLGYTLDNSPGDRVRVLVSTSELTPLNTRTTPSYIL